jgi:hypothetical protein
VLLPQRWGAPGGTPSQRSVLFRAEGLRIPFDELASVEIGRGAAEKLSILDQDVDAHQMMELAGPMHLQMGGQMMTIDGHDAPLH